MDSAINTTRSDGPEPVKKSVIAITGAAGFVGRKLIDALLRREDLHIRALVRSPDHALGAHLRLNVIAGDLARIGTSVGFLVPGCTVINLAYDRGATHAESMDTTEKLVQACKNHRIKRLIHCSTASVYGRSLTSVLNEEDECKPRTQYGITKLAIERFIHDSARGNFECINLRPTSVFGPGGAALMQMISSLENRATALNYLHACLSNRRKLNLVSVDTVVAAILFLLDKSRDVAGQTFIVSEDEDPKNNFEYVERYLLQKIFGKKYGLRPIRIPLAVLATVLQIMGRDNINPLQTFDSGKLRRLGFVAPRPLESSLSDFARWNTGKSDQGGPRNSAASSGR